MYKLLTKLRAVERMSTHPKLTSYNLLEHQYGVTLIFLEICKAENLEVTARDIELVMKHDILETLTGDVIYPAKNLNSITKEAWAKIEDQVAFHLSGEENLGQYSDENIATELGAEKTTIFKISDLLELAVFCKQERKLGNQNLGEVYFSCLELIKKLCGKRYDSVYKFINENLL